MSCCPPAASETAARRPGAPLHATLATLSRKPDTAAILYALKLWPALTRYADDGRIEIDNSAAERTLRGVALGRRNYLFAGADSDGERAAAMYGLIGTDRLNGIDMAAQIGKLPRAYAFACSRLQCDAVCPAR